MGRPASSGEDWRGRGYDPTDFSSKKPGSGPGSLEEKSMSQLRKKCLCSAAIPIALGVGLAAATGPGTGFAPVAQAQTANPCSDRKRVVQGKRGEVKVVLGGRGELKKK